MKKIGIITLILLACACSTTVAKDSVEEYLNKFKNHDQEVMQSLEQLIVYENLSEKDQELYRLIMRKQYQDLKFKTVQEYYNGDHALITEEIEVYDYKKSRQRASQYYNEHASTLTNEEYQRLQLEYMYQEKSRTKYTINFELAYEDEHWKLISPDYTVLQKIHGIYAGEEDP